MPPHQSQAGGPGPATPPLDAPVVLLGDAHLREGDPMVDAFVDFAETLPRDLGALAIVGDLFSAWIGRPELTRPHHARVLDALRRLRRRGCRLLYVEGNHDFFLAPLYLGDPLDSIAAVSLDLAAAGRRVHLAHGDLVNSRDRQYRSWRAVSKNPLFFRLFNLAPAGLRQRLVDSLESRLANTNLAFRGGFPFEECERYARPRIRQGTELLVFGHFHEERRIDYQEGERQGSVYVLPAWRHQRRCLRLEPGYEPAFVSA